MYVIPLNVVVPEIDAYPPISILPDTETNEANRGPSSISNLPVIRRSLEPDRNDDVVVFVPNLE